MNKFLKTWFGLTSDHALIKRWTRGFPQISSKLKLPVILQTRVSKTRGLISEFFLLTLPMFHEDKVFPSSKLIDYFEVNSVGNIYFFFLLEDDAHNNSLVTVQECVFPLPMSR